MTAISSNKIKAIDKEAVHRICSGQVVLNLATAIKELVENSLDAKATVIEVRLKEYGSELVEVTDNGCGVAAENFEGLTLKHHTSKLQDFSDLMSVETFGFRGEALSSLCALSQLTILTRHHSSSCGTLLVFDRNGKISSSTPVARQVGTTVCLENIFSALPVRQKEFHRNLKREFAKMMQLLYAYCLVSTGVRITCTNQTKKGGRSTIISTQGCKTIRENIACVFGTKQLSSLLELSSENIANKISSETLEELGITVQDLSIFQINGFISTCAHGQGRGVTDRQFYYINSRPCEPKKVMKIISEVYHQYNQHQFPFVFLNITVSRDTVDVNVTPDKRQIFLEHEKLLLHVVKSILLGVFETVPSTFTMNNISISSATSPKKNLVAALGPAAILSQWRHSNDKRSAEEIVEKKPFKQLRLDNSFSKKDNIPNKHINGLVVSSSETEKYPSTENSYSNIKQVEDEVHTIEQIIVENSEENINGETKPDLIHNCKEENFKISAFNSETVNSNTEVNKVSNINEITEFRSDNSSEVDQSNCETSNCDYVTEESIINDEIIGTVNKFSYNSDDINNGFNSEQSFGETNVESDTGTPQVIVDLMETSNVSHRKCTVIDLTIEQLRKISSDRKNNLTQNEKGNVRFRALIEPSTNKQAEQELSREISKDMFSKMIVIGQFNLGFIIAQLGSDLFIVDQHATDEKYNFETLQKTTSLSNQKLVVPQQLDLTAVNECILVENLDVFKANGFEFQIDEKAPVTKKISLIAIPMSRNWTFGKEDIDELLFMLQDSPHTLCRPSRVRAMFALRACRKSVMIGTALSHSDMKRLLVHMGEIEQPWNCPHGRPTMRHLINLDYI